MSSGICNWSNCKQHSDIIYLKIGLCQKHWIEFCDLDEQGKTNKARAKIGLPEIDARKPKMTAEPPDVQQTNQEVNQEEQEQKEQESTPANIEQPKTKVKLRRKIRIPKNCLEE